MRFYVSPEYISPDKNIIEIKDKKEAHHIRDVMRLKEGHVITVFDGREKEYDGVIKKIDRDDIIIEIREFKLLSPRIPCIVTLYQAIPKKATMDFIIEKAVELGVRKISPIITERTIPILKEKARDKIERWRRIARSASKQCGRVDIPLIGDIINFDHALNEAQESELIILAALDNKSRPLREILRKSNSKNIAIFIGPEGDFSPHEVSMAWEIGCHICSLGSLVLRVETASIYILACLSYEYHN